jgi:glycerol 3-phosphatase-2
LDVPSFDGLVCDLDGVVYRGDQPIEGAPGAIAALRSRGVRIVFCTNNSTATPGDFVAKLRAMGVPARADEIVTSAVVTAEVLAGRGLRGARALVVGGRGLRRALADAGLRLYGGEPSRADVVAVGLDTSFDYAAMRAAADAVRAGALFVATNDDATLPVAGGREWPGAGALVAAVATAAGRSPEVMGKPNAPMMDVVESRLEGAGSIAIVGDRPQTDLRGGAARGWTTVLVLTGVTPPQSAAQITPAPDFVANGLADLAP